MEMPVIPNHALHLRTLRFRNFVPSCLRGEQFPIHDHATITYPLDPHVSPALHRAVLRLGAARAVAADLSALHYSLGGTPFQVGLVLACFAVTSVIFRPIIGGWADQWSEPGVSLCGLTLLALAVLICFIPLAEATMFANALRGIGWAAMSAAGYSLLALSAPPSGAVKLPAIIAACRRAGRYSAGVALWLIAAPFGGFASSSWSRSRWPPLARLPRPRSSATCRRVPYDPTSPRPVPGGRRFLASSTARSFSPRCCRSCPMSPFRRWRAF